MSTYLKSLDISGSGLTAQKLRLDIISQNIANAEVTRTANGGPYRRKVPVLKSEGSTVRFKDVLEAAKEGRLVDRVHRRLEAASEGEIYHTQYPLGDDLKGVKVESIIEDQTEFVPVYDPNHPDANEDGYVMYPNVDITQEIIDAMNASRTYEANITAYNAVKQMLQQAMDMKL